jgi:endoglucanase
MTGAISTRTRRAVLAAVAGTALAAGPFAAPAGAAGLQRTAAKPHARPAAATTAAVKATSAAKAAANPNPSNPLANITWGNYNGSLDPVFNAYDKAQGNSKKLLGKIAFKPRVRWFGSWAADNKIYSILRQYIENVTGGKPNVLVQMAIFRLVPWEGEATKRLPTKAEIASYKLWINNAALAIGNTHVAMILQPDLPIAFKVPHGSHWAQNLVRFAARRFGELENTAVYIDVGAADWPTVAQAVSLLKASGQGVSRGFALDATHYDSTASEIAYGTKVVAALNRAGVHNKHFVIDTADNGKPFTYMQYFAMHPGGDFDNAQTCTSKTETRCVTLGIPPTNQVGLAKWHLPAKDVPLAKKNCDGYLWFGRPWLFNQAGSFEMSRALAVARTTPF